MSPEEIKRIVTETFARYETHFREPAKITEYMHENGTWRLMGKTPRSGVKNKADYTASLIHTKDVSDTGLRITPTSFLIQGDKAAVEAESYMKMKDGREYQNQYVFLIEFRDGKIFSVKEYMDTDYLTRFFSGKF
jgi:ketosteroid isomerase-like protein